jgi:hypothetical protein
MSKSSRAPRTESTKSVELDAKAISRNQAARFRLCTKMRRIVLESTRPQANGSVARSSDRSFHLGNDSWLALHLLLLTVPTTCNLTVSRLVAFEVP